MKCPISGHLERSLYKAKGEIQEHTDDTLDKQKYLATEVRVVIIMYISWDPKFGVPTHTTMSAYPVLLLVFNFLFSC